MILRLVIVGVESHVDLRINYWPCAISKAAVGQRILIVILFNGMFTFKKKGGIARCGRFKATRCCLFSCIKVLSGLYRLFSEDLIEVEQ